jgi:hypothetical protein
VLSALGGLLAAATGPRTAIAVAGVLILATPLLLPRSQASRGRRQIRTPGGPTQPA